MSNAKTRTESDSMGEVEVPEHALYGAQTQRALTNFQFSQLTMPEPFIRSLALLKSAAAQANQQLGVIPEAVAQAIQAAASEIWQGKHLDQFPLDVFQTGSGTSTNMNMNEVLARLASREQVSVHPNDHVNASQSSNDVIPTTLLVSTAIVLQDQLQPALQDLVNAIDNKAQGLADTVKTGRTHLMDAMPMTMAQELSAWAAQLHHSIAALNELRPRLQTLPQGGTAVGTGINAPAQFAEHFCRILSETSELHFTPSTNKFAGLAGQELSLQLAGVLNGLASTLMKISNDLRWMNSGPLAGLGEIELEALQPGSSIMPGKVNPVIPEAVAMIAAQLSGHYNTINIAAQAGNFQLNVMLPVITYNLHQMLALCSTACAGLGQAISSFKVNHEHLSAALARNPILVTALNPVIGYNQAAKIAKQAYQQQRPIIEVAAEHTDLSRAELERLLDPRRLTKGGLDSDPTKENS